MTAASPGAPVRQRIFDHERIWRLDAETFAAGAHLLADHERPHQPDAVVAIARGGIPLGRALARSLNVPLATITLRHNHDDAPLVQATGHVDVVDAAALADIGPGRRILVADDICGTGATFVTVAALLRTRLAPMSVRTVVLCRNAASLDSDDAPDSGGYLWDTRDWVIFPWNEPPDQPTTPLTLPDHVRAWR
ncbi:phosphoribosyltransferase family protein [Nonomuraea sp. NPDC049695]|uniref:phosphoribosyltransferase n=1 Tax=Nonomuraea sp. NPDC049695 TaxID=3154734 RepID=UPI0034383E7C